MNEKVRELINAIDEQFQKANCNMLDALNAVSAMSTHLAHNVGLSRAVYLEDIAKMYDSSRPKGEPVVVEEDENE